MIKTTMTTPPSTHVHAARPAAVFAIRETYTYTNRAYCDLCGAEVQDAPTYECGDGVRWSTEDNRIAETHVSLIQGTWERKDGSPGRVKHTTVHLCPQCFTTRLLPWLRQHGAQPSVLRCDTEDEDSA